MSDNIKDRIIANVSQVRETGSKRVSSIKKIIAEAASQTVDEFREGTSEIRENARDVLKSAVAELKESENVQALGATGKRVMTNPKETVSSLLKNVKNRPIADQLREKAANLDSELSERYGEQYESLSQKRRQVVEWYSKTLENSNAEGVIPVDKHQARAHDRVSQAGSSVARKEQQIKDYFKTVFKRFDSSR